MTRITMSQARALAMKTFLDAEERRRRDSAMETIIYTKEQFQELQEQFDRLKNIRSTVNSFTAVFPLAAVSESKNEKTKWGVS